MLEDERSRRHELVVRALARRVSAARRDPGAFFELVMREETSRRRLVLAAHQRLLFDFVMAHERCVVRMPVGFSKTYCMTALSVWLLGQDPTSRGAVVSSTQGQAAKVVGAARDVIQESEDLRLVFPELQPSARESEPWQQTQFTVARPYGIRDPSLRAVGVGMKISGSRLKWILIDDILSLENTATEEARQKVVRWVNSTVLNRRDLAGARVVVCNTPWEKTDLTFALQERGWPTLEMDVYGNVRIWNTDWDTDQIRPSRLREQKGEDHRLTANDNAAVAADAGIEVQREVWDEWLDELDQVPLWPQKFDARALAKLCEETDPLEWARGYLMLVRDEEGQRVKIEWVEACKAKARARDVLGFVGSWSQGKAVTGVDLGFSKRRTSAYSVIFTFAVLPDRHRQVLEVQFGRWSGGETIERLRSVVERYNSIVRVETNGAQDLLRQWMLEKNVSFPVRAHNTGKEKHDPRHGLEAMFIEVQNGAWIIPNDLYEKCPEAAQKWVDSMLYFDPKKHTSDFLMASWLAREQARDAGLLFDHGQGLGGSVAAAIGAR